MPPDSRLIETLKNILETSLQPQELDTHPWTKSLIALEADADPLDPSEKSAGQRLVLAIGKLFTQMMPGATPRHGKRLDTRWGEFGILAAQYFAPLHFGTPSPASLRDAWGRIDQSILYFVYGKPGEALSDAEKETYKLVGDELEVAPNSTLSDWHRKGLQRLAELILAREHYLSKSLSTPAVISQDGQVVVQIGDASPASEPEKNKPKTRKLGGRRWIVALLLLILVGLALVGGLEARKVYELAVLVRQDAVKIQNLASGSTSRTEQIKQVGPALAILRQDFKTLQDETEPFLWLGPRLEWVPVYGGDLASAPELVTLADSLLASADLSYQALTPVLDAYDATGYDPAKLVGLLNQAQPQLIEARHSLDLALAARSNLKPERLSPFVSGLILDDVDRVLPLLDDGLTFALEIPRLMGASEEGPKTYLLLVQNEDELRPTGGFITAAGTLLLQDGRITSLSFQNSGNFDDWTKPYPAAPWQLSQYMNSRVLIFRDTNWFTNYPTAALNAEHLYSYVSDHSVDGIIAFDQQLLVELLGILGPIQMDDVPYLIDSSNVIGYMRTSKTPTADEAASPEWNNKIFINKISRALITKLFSGEVQLEPLSTVLLQALDEHHLLIQLDSPSMTTLLARYHWDGVVRPAAGGDFLMVVNSNVGFNKTNAVVETDLFYDVDLTAPAKPVGSLTVVHKNYAVGTGACHHWNKIRAPGESDYPIEDCYWDYLRVYLPVGTSLLDATPQTIPAEWMILKESPAPKVDVLNEDIPGVQAFGTIQVVPYGQSLTASFRFALPAGILQVQPETGWMIYHLKVQKQPGTLAVPITLRIHLPNNASIQAAPEGATIQNNNILLQINLRTDLEIEVVFQLP